LRSRWYQSGINIGMYSSFMTLLSRGTHPKLVKLLLGLASIQLTLDRYSHWIPSRGTYTASAMDEALG
jgi:hypothetical protein